MPEIRKLLVPVDFSDVSRKALNYGISIANVFNADLLVANVIEESPAASPTQGSTPETRNALAELKAKLEALIPDDVRESVNCHCIVTSGEVENELLAVVSREQADLIVMGTHGRRAFKRWMLGCVTERILPKISVPIITVSHLENDDARWPVSKGRFLYATDLSHGSEAGIQRAHELAKRFGAQLTVLHVMSPWSGIMSGLSEGGYANLRKTLLGRLEESIPKAIQVDPAVQWELREGNPYQTILDVADEKNADLIVVNLHGEHRGGQEPLGSTAERVIRGAHKPVLSLPPGA